MNSSEFDHRFDQGESVLEALDLSGAQRRRLEQLDREASRLGVTRQSIIKLWLAERLERRSPPDVPPRSSRLGFIHQPRRCHDGFRCAPLLEPR